MLLRCSPSFRRISIRSLPLLASLLPAVVRAEWNVAQGRLTAEATATTTYLSNTEARRGAPDALFATLSPSLEFERQSALIETHASAGVEFDRTLEGRGFDREAKRASLAFNTAQASGRRFSPSLRTLYTESYSSDSSVNAQIFTRQSSTMAGGEMTFNPSLTAELTSKYETERTEGFAGRHTFENKGRIDSALGGRRVLFTEVTHSQLVSDTTKSNSASLDQKVMNTAVGLTQGFSSGTKASLGIGYMNQQRSAAETAVSSRQGSDFNVMASVDGPFLPPTLFPKLTSRVRVAYGRLESPGLGDDGNKQLTGELAVGWAARANTRLGLAAGRTRKLSVNNLTLESSHAHVLVDQTVGAATQIAASLGYEWTNVRGLNRKSEGRLAMVSATRKLGSRNRWEGRVAYDYRDLNSSDRIATFAQHTGRFSTTYRF